MKDLHIKIKEHAEKEGFSGTVIVKKQEELLVETAFGHADRSEGRSNSVDTRFGIASGCKLFTAVAICQLVEEERVSFHTPIKECLGSGFPHFDDKVTIHHLLTHTSGISDYFDEDVMDDFEELWKQTPMYLMRKGEDFLPLFQNGHMKFPPGERFDYNNAGYIILGLVIEKLSGKTVQEYIKEHIFGPANMHTSGYFRLDRLPANTAYGYIDEPEDSWRTNVFSIPIQGGADGGAYVTGPDMISFWESLLTNKLLSERGTKLISKSHAKVKEGVDYGYGMWLNQPDKHHVMGYDPGVSFHSAYYPEKDIKAVVLSNKSSGAFGVLKVIETYFNS
ncbi:penicillin-binding protein [Bacillus sp. AFS015802]|uniref:serine hydrolase domain-containing protein n=1 Tax=Bacillus sp. AFS015802 TaxID=2033486 RepID=UPI000BF5DA9D|nr:serine hydrolase [Bacillus sp. AFS015802]PFA67669.1 penicillin-binding protein [Bacillus sp. AFS015802]